VVEAQAFNDFRAQPRPAGGVGSRNEPNLRRWHFARITECITELRPTPANRKLPGKMNRGAAMIQG
jgi:hypothetical protein